MALVFEIEDMKESTGEALVKATEDENAVFVYNELNEFVNIATPSEMLTLPDSPAVGGNYRKNSIEIIVRDVYTAASVEEDIKQQVGSLLRNLITPANGAVLFDNT